MKSLSDNLHRRLTLSKYLFRQARRILLQSEAYSRGLATSLLHDSVEVFLRVLTERFKIEVPRRENFLQLFDNVRKSIDCVGEHSAAIKRLNTARVGFKHEGLDVSATDVEAFLTNVEAFLSEVCKQELRIDFATLSLVNAIGHRRTQNWLEKARESLRSEHYTESVAHSAAAMAIYLHHRDTRRGERVDPSYLIDSSSSKLGDVVDWILEYVEPIRARLDLVSHGIDVVSYDKFEALTPETSVGRDGVVTQYGLKSKTASSREDARFCYDFAVDSALAACRTRDSRLTHLIDIIALKISFRKDPVLTTKDLCRKSDRLLALHDIEMPARIQQTSHSVRARVTTPCPLIVHPRTNPPEVIRVAEASEELLIAPELDRGMFPPDRSEFVPVIQDGDVAYVRRDYLADGVEVPK